MARVELPQSRLKLRRRRRLVRAAWRIPLFVLIIAVVLIGLLAWGSHAPFLRVTSINVSGAQTVATGTVDNFVEHKISGSYLFVFAKNDILLYPRAGIKAGLLAAYPQFKTADVHAANFHTVAVTITERQPVALWCTASSTNCYLMDQDGVIYMQYFITGNSPYVTYEGATTQGSPPMQFLTQDEFHSLSALVGALSQKMGTTTISDVSVDASGDVSATFSDGFVLRFLLADAGGDVFERFSLALQSDIFKSHALGGFEYLDLRFGDKLYYKLKTQ